MAFFFLQEHPCRPLTSRRPTPTPSSHRLHRTTAAVTFDPGTLTLGPDPGTLTALSSGDGVFISFSSQQTNNPTNNKLINQQAYRPKIPQANKLTSLHAIKPSSYQVNYPTCQQAYNPISQQTIKPTLLSGFGSSIQHACKPKVYRRSNQHANKPPSL